MQEQNLVSLIFILMISWPYFAGSDSQICGIVNSDIYLLGEKFHSFISKEAVDSLVYGSRIDIKALDNLQGKLYGWGFDYFFFDRKIINSYPKSDFCRTAVVGLLDNTCTDIM
ncbi:hypothetical protein [Pelosinus baikalensis]|nr:hypothetical protein [Pelosinus baikalensis]